MSPAVPARAEPAAQPPIAAGAGQVLALARSRAGRVALADAGGGRTVRYPGLARTVSAAAAGLARRGTRPGDIVGLRVADAVSFAIGALVIRTAGGVPAPVSPGATAGEAGAQLSADDVRVLLASASLAPQAIALAERSRVRQVICLGGSPPGTMPFAVLLSSGTMRPLPRDERDLALLPCPRGCGGPRPSGGQRRAGITYRDLAEGLRQLAAAEPAGTWDVVIAPPPCGDGGRYAALLDLALTQGATIVAAPTTAAGDLLAAARERAATAVIAPAEAGFPRLASLRVLTVPS